MPHGSLCSEGFSWLWRTAEEGSPPRGRLSVCTLHGVELLERGREDNCLPVGNRIGYTDSKTGGYYNALSAESNKSE